jgi:hypothetical protein
MLCARARRQIFAVKVGLQEAFSQLLNSWLRMGPSPSAQEAIVFQRSMSGGQVVSLEDKSQRNPASRVIGNYETHSIEGTRLR